MCPHPAYSVLTPLLYSSAVKPQTCHLPSLSHRYFICRVKGWPGKFPIPSSLTSLRKHLLGLLGETDYKGQMSQGNSGALKRNLSALLLREDSLSEPGFPIPFNGFFLVQAPRGAKSTKTQRGPCPSGGCLGGEPYLSLRMEVRTNTTFPIVFGVLAGNS